MLDDVIANGRANATHVCLLHNPAGVGGQTDKECIHRKKARFTIARVLIRSRFLFEIKEMALHLWIDTFLPKFNRDIFDAEELNLLRNQVREMG